MSIVLCGFPMKLHHSTNIISMYMHEVLMTRAAAATMCVWLASVSMTRQKHC